MLAVLRDSSTDFAAEKHLGLAVRTNRTAGFSWRPIDQLLQWKVLAIAKPYAESDRVAGTAAALGYALLL